MFNFSRFLKFPILLMTATFLLFGCGEAGGGSSNPSAKNAKGQLSVDLPIYMELSSFKVVAFENFGTQVDPEIRARFTADAKITEPLYMETGQIDGKSILAKTLAKGHDIRIAGKYQAELRGERWVIDFENVQIAPNIVDKPLSNWNAGRYVFEGSDEEAALRATAETKQLQKNEADKERKRVAEKNRIEAYKATQERKRIEAEERGKTAKLQSKLAVEKAVREQEEARKRAAEQRTQMAAIASKRQAESDAKAVKHAAFRKEITGQWESVSPVLGRNGEVYVRISGIEGCVSAIKFSLTIPVGEFETVASPISIYMTENSRIRKDTEATVVANGETKSLRITFPSFDLGCTIGNSSYTVYEALGKPWSGTVIAGRMVLQGGRNRTITMRKVGG
ncbi:MAG: hypothetical protein COA91_02210 [Robiginitomaculum sp.]|nr:MAG: hypothetical protein COA91_02210 [Robiginitomaculum sp.]